jgi:hypothetical protein
MSDVTKFAEKVLSEYCKRITDEVFLLIAADRELMQEYLRLVESSGLDTVNRWIGRKVKERFGLENETGDTGREYSPRSTLIQSHQKFYIGDVGSFV